MTNPPSSFSEPTIPLVTTQIIWYACILGSLISLPFTEKFQAAYPYTPSFYEILPLLLGIALIATIVYEQFLTYSSFILKKIELRPFVPHSLYAIVFPALAYGLLFGLVFVVTKRFFFPSLVLPSGALDSIATLIKMGSSSGRWHLLGSVYATFNVEVVERLCLLPTLLFLLNIKKGSPQPWRDPTVLWSSLFLTGLIAGTFPLIGIQPFAERAGPLLASGLVESIIQNLLLGWLFVKKGFWTSSLAHLAIYTTVIIGLNISSNTIVL